MNWNMIGAIGEVVGAMAVVVTLLYLARQVRSSSLESQRLRYRELTENIVNVANTWAESDTLSDIMIRGLRDPTALAPPEAFRFYTTLFGLMKAWEASHHYSLERGMHDWGAAGLSAALRSYMTFPGMQRYFDERRDWYSAEFQAEVDRVIAAGAKRVDDSY